MATEQESLDSYIDAAASVLALPLTPESKRGVRANLEVMLKFAALVEEFPLPDETEPATVFRA